MSHPSTPHAQSKPIKISGNESTKSSSSSTASTDGGGGSSADSSERLICLTKQNTIVKAPSAVALTAAAATAAVTGVGGNGSGGSSGCGSGGAGSTASGCSDDNNVDDFHYEAIVDPQNVTTKPKYAYHDEPHSFENSMEFLEDYKNFQYEVLETTV